MKILFWSKWYPYPPTNGSKIRIWNLLQVLAARHEVTLVCFREGDADLPVSPELGQICAQVLTVPWKGFSPYSFRARLGLFSAAPRSHVDTFSPEMKRLIRRTLAENEFDVIIGSELEALNYGTLFRRYPAVLEDPELGVIYGRYRDARSRTAQLRHSLTWFKWRRYLAKELAHFSAATVVSKQEQQLLAKVRPDYENVHVIPNCIDLAKYRISAGRASPQTMIFTGSFRYAANYEAMKWFVQAVLPLIEREAPDVQLVITGDHAGLPFPKADNITLAGYVSDVRPLIRNAVVSLAPLLVGGGTRLKILEALALGTPVVATSKGAEGLDTEHETHLLIADDAAAFAAAVLRIYHDQPLRRKLTQNGYQLVAEKYDWAVVQPDFLRIVEAAADNYE